MSKSVYYKNTSIIKKIICFFIGHNKKDILEFSNYGAPLIIDSICERCGKFIK
jgi:hypothetical protein